MDSLQVISVVVGIACGLIGAIGGGVGVYVALRVELAALRAEFAARLQHVETDLGELHDHFVRRGLESTQGAYR